MDKETLNVPDTEEKKTAMASPVLSCSAADYVEVLHDNISKLIVDDTVFIPKYQGRNAIVRASLPNGPIAMPYRSVMEIDCGFSIELSEDSEIFAEPLPSFSSRGLMISGLSREYYNSGRFSVYVVNVGKEIITLQNEEEFALIKLFRNSEFNFVTN